MSPRPPCPPPPADALACSRHPEREACRLAVDARRWYRATLAFLGIHVVLVALAGLILYGHVGHSYAAEHAVVEWRLDRLERDFQDIRGEHRQLVWLLIGGLAAATSNLGVTLLTIRAQRRR